MIRHLPSHGKRVGIYVQRRRFKCRSCGRTFSEALPDVDDKREMTTRLVQWIGKQSLKRPFAHIAKECGVADKTVRLIYADYVDELQKRVRIEAHQMMGIDEIHIIRRPRCVIGNIQHNTIVDMLPDRNKALVARYLTNLLGKEKVKYVAMNMWTPYCDACRAVLPQAQIVVDKFHVLRMANQGMENVRKALRSGMELRQRRGLMNDRFVMLKRPT